MQRRITLCTRQTKTPIPAFQRVTSSFGFERTLQGNKALDSTPRDVVWIQGNPIWYPRVISSVRAMPAAKRPKVVVWLTEPLPPPAESGFKPRRLSLREIVKIAVNDVRVTDPYSNSRRLVGLAKDGVVTAIAVSSMARKVWLAGHGVQSEFIPIGYVPTLGHDMGLERDVEVLFIGTPDDPRHRYCVRYLKKRGVSLMAVGGYDKRGIWGEERNRLVNRAKIFVCLQRQAGELSGARMLLGMANKSMVLSEPTYLPDPYIPGTHYVSAPLEEFPERIQHYLSHEDERVRIAEQGHDFVCEEVTMEKSLVKMCAMINSTFSGESK
jgi:hypothetical protein